MRTQTLLLSLALASTPALAQNAADQPGSSSPQEMQGNSMKGSESMKMMHEGAQKAHDNRKGDSMSGQHQTMLKSAQDDLDGMRRQLEIMKEQTGDIADQSRREGMELNNDMWQGLIEHMDKHMAQMQNMMSSQDGKPCVASAKIAGQQHYAQ